MPVSLNPGHVPPPYTPEQDSLLLRHWKTVTAAQNYPSGDDKYLGHEAVNACRRFFPLVGMQRPKVLFMGCGDGTEVRRAIDECGLDAWGVTLNPNNIHNAREVLGLENVYYHDAHCNPPEWEGTFDAVMGFQFLEHSQSPIILLMEADRILRRGGFVYFETPHPGGFTMDANPHHITCPVYEQAMGWLLKVGFADARVETLAEGADAARHLGIFGRKA